MKKKEWNEGLNNLAPDIVENYIEQKEKFAKMNNSRDNLIHIVATVACLFFVVSSIVVGILVDDKIPTWENAQYSAEDIARMFNTANLEYDGVTNTYTNVYVPDSKYLYIDEIPKDEYLGIYQYNNVEKELNKNEFKSFIDGILPELSSSIGIETPSYKILEEKNYENIYFLDTDLDIIGDKYRIIFEQGSKHYWFHISCRSESDRKIIFDGETIQIDQSLSDEEIIESIESIKNNLFDILNVSFSDTKIIRKFDEYSEHNANFIYIYFYNEEDHFLNSMSDYKISDYICIAFDNTMNYAGDIVSDRILSVASIQYYKRRYDIQKTYPLIGNAKKISLQDAEKLLYKGYVFGGHSCPLCMATQEKISFRGYDYVDIEYVFGYVNKTAKTRIAIPFYAFYKKIGTAKNGNEIYAKTYVSAIELKGYEEYFESQKSKHSQS